MVEDSIGHRDEFLFRDILAIKIDILGESVDMFDKSEMSSTDE